MIVEQFIEKYNSGDIKDINLLLSNKFLYNNNINRIMNKKKFLSYIDYLSSISDNKIDKIEYKFEKCVENKYYYLILQKYPQKNSTWIFELDSSNLISSWTINFDFKNLLDCNQKYWANSFNFYQNFLCSFIELNFCIYLLRNINENKANICETLFSLFLIIKKIHNYILISTIITFFIYFILFIFKFNIITINHFIIFFSFLLLNGILLSIYSSFMIKIQKIMKKNKIDFFWN